jgi:hypothetical protein
MPATITAFLPMTFVCKWHPDCELEVFQPQNSVAFVGKCIKCQQEQDAKDNNINKGHNDKNRELVLRIGKLNSQLNYLRAKIKKGGKK